MEKLHYNSDDYLIKQEPFYQSVGNEIDIFDTASNNGLPILIKGPTGCGKTRFVEFMAWRLNKPLISVSCHDDLTTSDMLGRYLVRGGETVWIDGPLTSAVRAGGICYLDEFVEARKDTTVVIHSLTDDRRILTIDKTGELIKAPDDFCLVISYNPGYQSILKDLKQSTRQRFVALAFDYPAPELEINILIRETGIDQSTADNLVKFGHMTRNLKGNGLEEGASTRLLVHAARLMKDGINSLNACQSAIAEALTDDNEMLEAIRELSDAVF